LDAKCLKLSLVAMAMITRYRRIVIAMAAGGEFEFLFSTPA